MRWLNSIFRVDEYSRRYFGSEEGNLTTKTISKKYARAIVGMYRPLLTRVTRSVQNSKENVVDNLEDEHKHLQRFRVTAPSNFWVFVFIAPKLKQKALLASDAVYDVNRSAGLDQQILLPIDHRKALLFRIVHLQLFAFDVSVEQLLINSRVENLIAHLQLLQIRAQKKDDHRVLV